MSEYKLPDYLMVSPTYNDEVIGKSGEIGLLIAGYELEDTFFLRFEDGQLGDYPAQALIALRQPREIYDHLEWNSQELQKADFRALHNIAILLEYGNLSSQKKAFMLAKANPVILEAGTIRLNEALGDIYYRRPTR